MNDETQVGLNKEEIGIIYQSLYGQLENLAIGDVSDEEDLVQLPRDYFHDTHRIVPKIQKVLMKLRMA